VLRRIFGPKRKKGSKKERGQRRLRNVGIYNLYSSLNIIMVIKSRRMKSAGQVARMVQMRNSYILLSENLKEGDHVEGLGVHGNMILK